MHPVRRLKTSINPLAATMRIPLLLGLAFFCLNLSAQESPDSLRFRPHAYIQAVGKQAEKLDEKLTRENQKVLRKWERQRTKLLRQLAQKDAAAAQQLQARFDQQADQFKKTLENPTESLGQYLPGLDSLQTSLSFLQSDLREKEQCCS